MMENFQNKNCRPFILGRVSADYIPEANLNEELAIVVGSKTIKFVKVFCLPQLYSI